MPNETAEAHGGIIDNWLLNPEILKRFSPEQIEIGLTVLLEFALENKATLGAKISEALTKTLIPKEK